MANDRLAQLPVEVAVSPSDAKARLAQEAVEVGVVSSTPLMRTAQLVVEVAVHPLNQLVSEVPNGLITVSIGTPVDINAPEAPRGVITISGSAPSVPMVAAPAASTITVSAPPPAVWNAWLVNIRPFVIGGFGTLLHERPFSILAAAPVIRHSRPFSIHESPLQTWEPPASLATTLSAPASAGATSISLTDTADVVPGMFLEVGGEVVRVSDTWVSGNPVTLTAPLVSAHSGGIAVTQSSVTAPEFNIYDKAGVYLGTLEDAYISAAPTHLINGQGNAAFYAPRNATNLSLLKGDRLVLIGDPYGDPWAGAIGGQDWGDSKQQLNLPDLFSLLDLSVSFDMEIGDGTTATGVYGIVLDTFNAQKTDSGEIRFGRDFTGARTFNGDLVYRGSYMGALDLISARSMTEYALRYSVSGNQLVATLVVRDRFESAAAGTLLDGGMDNSRTDATIIGDIRYREDVTAIRNAIRLVGQPTDIRSLVPDWAAWAVHEVEPYVELSNDLVDPENRERDIEVIQVDWSLSKAEQRHLADLTMQTVREMYYTFLYAVHDELGRPWHDGWSYLGPPDIFDNQPGSLSEISGEAQLHRERFLTYRRLAEWKNLPVSLVMRSGSKSKRNLQRWEVVHYDRVTGIQSVFLLPDAALDLGFNYFVTLVPGIHYQLYTVNWMTAALSDIIVGAGEVVEVGAKLNTLIPLPTVTYRYGGVPDRRGIKRFVRAVWIRSSPYLRDDNHVRLAVIGELFSVRQSTEKGSSWNGSTVWLGNAAGTEWAPHASLVFVRHNVGVPLVLRQMQSGPYNGKWIDADALGALTPANGGNSQFVTKIYPFEKALIARYDPRREGIGIHAVRPHVDYTAVSTKVRWFRETWAAGEASTSLESGINSSTTTLLVQVAFGFPPPPFKIQVGDSDTGNQEEVMRVTYSEGTQWTVERGQDGTTAVIHEDSESVVLLDAPVWDGFVFDWEWQAGQAYAEAVLAVLSRPEVILDLEAVAGLEGMGLGSIHTVDIETEGPWGAGIQGAVRVVGYSRDPLEGTIGLVVEEEPVVPPIEPSTYELSGVLRADGTPTSGIVWAYQSAPGGPLVNAAIAAAGGGYSVTLPADTYKLWVTDVPGYPAQAHGGASIEAATVIDLTSSDQTININVHMVP